MLQQYLAALLDTEAWRTQAACLGMDLSHFFPERGQSQRIAKEACARCQVRAECAASAEAHTEEYGRWGGRMREPGMNVAPRPKPVRVVVKAVAPTPTPARITPLKPVPKLPAHSAKLAPRSTKEDKRSA